MVVLHEVFYVNLHLLDTSCSLRYAQISVHVFWLIHKLLLNLGLIVGEVNFIFLGEVTTL